MFCLETYLPHIGGTEVLAAEFCSEMIKRGHKIIIVTSHSAGNHPDLGYHQGIPVHRFAFHKPLVDRNIQEMLKVRKKISELKKTFCPDIVHLNNIAPDSFYHLQSTHIARAPILITIHGLPMFSDSKEFGNNNLTTKAIQSADWVAAVSKATKAEIIDLFPGASSKLSVIHNGLKMPELKPQPISFSPPRLLCIGRLVPLKGFDLAIKAFIPIAERYPNSKLTIAGDGPARKELEQLTHELHVNEAVEFLGSVDPQKIPELINQNTMVIMPSTYESFGLVAVQAAQMERPIVATNVGGLKEVILHGQTGLLVNNHDQNELTEKIFYLLENPEIAAEMGKNARKHVSQLFGFDRYINEYESLYSKLKFQYTKSPGIVR
jgi:glycosyltransferase involved in cell wall biosynthesis